MMRWWMHVTHRLLGERPIIPNAGVEHVLGKAAAHAESAQAVARGICPYAINRYGRPVPGYATTITERRGVLYVGVWRSRWRKS